MEKKSRELLAPHVEEELMDYILHTPVKIGEKLPNEFELAELFGVGRSTVRETVKSLVSKGVLEVRRGSGTYVIGTNRLEDDPLGLSGFTDKYELALDLCNVRLMLEPEIAMLASENATDEEKAELKRLCDEVENLYLAGENHLQKDVEFHDVIYKSTNNLRLIQMLNNLREQMYRYRLEYLKDGTSHQKLVEEHEAIIEALSRRDTEETTNIMVGHVYNQEQAVMRKIHEAESTGPLKK